MLKYKGICVGGGGGRQNLIYLLSVYEGFIIQRMYLTHELSIYLSIYLSLSLSLSPWLSNNFQTRVMCRLYKPSISLQTLLLVKIN